DPRVQAAPAQRCRNPIGSGAGEIVPAFAGVAGVAVGRRSRIETISGAAGLAADGPCAGTGREPDRRPVVRCLAALGARPAAIPAAIAGTVCASVAALAAAWSA